MKESDQHLMTLFEAALDCESETERIALLDRECGQDVALRARVEALLHAHEGAGRFLEPGTRTPTIDATAAEVADSSLAGTVLAGKYKLLEPIGEGGMGAVWTAQQIEPVKRLVAVKLIKAGMDSKQVLARFEAERQALALMDHPNIAKVFDGGATADGRPFFVMELVRGVPITKYCDEHHLTPRQRLELFVPVCQAIQHAHQKGIIHRDIKPSNVLVAMYDDRPVPKVIDFGVAKATGRQLTEETLHTGLGAVVGTVEYMSPEQASLNELDVDTRSDVYSLGVLLYELLAGSPPFTKKELEAAGVYEMLRVIREQEPSKPSAKLSTAEVLPTLAANRGTEPSRLTKLVRGELDWIVMKSLEKDRARRYETANGLAMDLLRYLADEPVQACPPSASYRLRKFVRRNKRPVLAAMLVFFALLIGTAVSTWQMVRANRAEVKASDERDKAVEAEADTRVFSDFLVHDVLSSTRPKGEEGGLGKDVTVRAALDAAVANLTERFRGRPRAEAIAREAIGNTYRMIGDWPNADLQLRRALELRRQVLGPDHEDTLRGQHNLAVLLLYDEVPVEAEALLEETVRLRTIKLGADHRDTLASMSQLGYAYGSTGKLPESVRLLEQTLALQRARFGADDPDVLVTANSLASRLRMSGRLDEALPLYVDNLRRVKVVRGPAHPDTIDAVHFLGRAYQEAGRAPEAVPLLEEAVKLNKAQRGVHHARTYGSMERLASVYQAVDRVPDAVPVLEQLVKLHKDSPYHGSNSPHTLGHTTNLARAYLATGRVKSALLLLEDTVIRLDETAPTYDPYHSGFPRTFNGLSEAYRETELVPEARQLRPRLRESILSYAEVVLRHPDHAGLAQAASQYADLLPEQGEGQVRAASFLVRGIALVATDDKLSAEKREQLAGEYGNRAVQLLRQAVAKGFPNVDELRNSPAFAPLRSRDDFKQLMMELEAPRKK